jgi:hypothetical protein
VVQRLDDELLVYDTAFNEAHCLDSTAAAEFAAAADDISRRQVIRRLALAGAATATAGSLLRTVVTPPAAQAQSACLGATVPCTSDAQCCSNFCGFGTCSCLRTGLCQTNSDCASGCCCHYANLNLCVDTAEPNPSVCCTQVAGGTCS